MPRRRKKVIRVRTGVTAVKAMRVAKKAIRMIAGEMKVLQTSGTATAIPDGAGATVQISNIATGDTSILREGNMILIKKIEIDIMLKLNASASSSQVRVILVRDKQANGAVIPVNDFLEVVTNFLSLLSPRDHNFLQRFTVLYDKVHVLNRPGVAAIASNTRHIHIRKKQNIKIRYDGVVGDITDIQTNSYALVFISNEPTNEPTFDHFVRLSFIDN